MSLNENQPTPPVIRNPETSPESVDLKGQMELNEKVAGLHPAPDGYPIKLVRDHTPCVINGTGKPGELFYGALHANLNRAEWLYRKLGEEVVEYLIGRTTAELCDVLAVIDALLIIHGETLDSASESLKAHPRGGFSHAVMMYGRHPEFDRALIAAMESGMTQGAGGSSGALPAATASQKERSMTQGKGKKNLGEQGAV